MRLISKLLCSSVLVCASLAASANPYSSLVIFGDSLSDSGNNSIAISNAIGGPIPGQTISGNGYVPSLPYNVAPFGTYSNGPVWATQFADMLGLSALPSLIPGGTNFAFGGATTSTGSPVPSLMTQTAMFLGGTGGVAPSDALYVVAGGGNNIRATLTALAGVSDAGTFNSIVSAAALQYATDIGNIVDNLQAAGAQDIIVWNAPNLGVAPAVTSIGFGAIGTIVSGSFNAALAGRLASETGIKTFDLFGLAAQAAANGFTNTTDACGAPSNGGVCPNISQALFWDGIHPTTAAHHLIAERMLVTAVPEPETWALMLMGLGFITYRARRRTVAPVLAAA